MDEPISKNVFTRNSVTQIKHNKTLNFKYLSTRLIGHYNNSENIYYAQHLTQMGQGHFYIQCKNRSVIRAKSALQFY